MRGTRFLLYISFSLGYFVYYNDCVVYSFGMIMIVLYRYSFGMINVCVMLVFLMTVGFAGCLQKCLLQIVKWMIDIKPELINQLIMLIIQGRRQAKNIGGIE
jgi:hypothetical protein